MELSIDEALLIIEHEIEHMQTIFDYKDFYILQSAFEQLQEKLNNSFVQNI